MLDRHGISSSRIAIAGKSGDTKKVWNRSTHPVRTRAQQLRIVQRINSAWGADINAAS